MERALAAGLVLGLVAIAVPALGVLALLFYVWALLVSGWMLAQGVRTSEPVAV